MKRICFKSNSSPCLFHAQQHTTYSFHNVKHGFVTKSVSTKKTFIQEHPSSKISSPLLEASSLLSSRSTSKIINSKPTSNEKQTKNYQSEDPEEKKEPWNPIKKLVRSDMEKIRELHHKDPKTNTISHLSKMFKIPNEAVKRILRSKWSPPAEVVVRQDVKKMIERKFATSHGTIPYRIKEQLDLLSQVSKIWENNPKDHEATIHLYQISKEITSLTKTLLPAKVLASLGIIRTTGANGTSNNTNQES